MPLDPVACLHQFNAGREPERLALKFTKMRQNAFAFLRGSCHLFYDRLAEFNDLPLAPAAWLCGDLHLENFGSYKGDDRKIHFDVTDFDETALAPCSWDILRLLVSLRLVAPALGCTATDCEQLCNVYLDHYSTTLAGGSGDLAASIEGKGLIGELLTKADKQKRSDLLDNRTTGSGKDRRLRLDTGKALAVDDVERKLITEQIAGFAAAQPHSDFFEVIDLARRVAGTGSLGLARYVLLVEGRGGADGNFLLDLKAIQASSLEPHLQHPAALWNHPVDRVITLQRRLQAAPMACLHGIHTEQGSYVLRELQASEDRIDLRQAKGKISRLEKVLLHMGQLSAALHLRGAGFRRAAEETALQDFAATSDWRAGLLASSRRFANQGEADWLAFSVAYDAGAFRKG